MQNNGDDHSNNDKNDDRMMIMEKEISLNKSTKITLPLPIIPLGLGLSAERKTILDVQ